MTHSVFSFSFPASFFVSLFLFFIHFSLFHAFYCLPIWYQLPINQKGREKTVQKERWHETWESEVEKERMNGEEEKQEGKKREQTDEKWKKTGEKKERQRGTESLTGGQKEGRNWRMREKMPTAASPICSLNELCLVNARSFSCKTRIGPFLMNLLIST